MEGSGAGSGSRSESVQNNDGSGLPKNIRIERIRIHNAAPRFSFCGFIWPSCTWIRSGIRIRIRLEQLNQDEINNEESGTPSLQFSVRAPDMNEKCDMMEHWFRFSAPARLAGSQFDLRTGIPEAVLRNRNRNFSGTGTVIKWNQKSSHRHSIKLCIWFFLQLAFFHSHFTINLMQLINFFLVKTGFFVYT